MQHVKIGMDMDNTLSDTTGVLIQLTNFKHETSYTLESVNDWDFWRKLGPAFEKSFWKIYDLMDSIYLRRAAPPVHPLSCGIVKMLEKQGHMVKILTANAPEAKSGIVAWLFGHGLETEVDLIGRISPGEKVKLDYDVFVDDSPKLIEPVSQTPEKTLILLTQPWNANIDVSAIPNVIRARDWRDIQDILETMGLLPRPAMQLQTFRLAQNAGRRLKNGKGKK